MLCLHGLGASIYSWRNFVAPFSQTHKLILVDFKGCGKSPKPRPASYSVDETVDEIYQLIVEEDLRDLTLVGNSLGGGIALLLAIRLGKESPNRLSKLILIDSAADISEIPLHIKLIRSFLGPPIMYGVPATWATRVILNQCYYERGKVSAEDVRAYATPISGWDGRYALLQSVRNCIPSNVDNLIDAVKSVTVPTLIVWGREDKIIPLRVGQLLHTALPNSTLEVIENCGHVPQEEKPEETIEIIKRFLELPSD